MDYGFLQSELKDYEWMDGQCMNKWIGKWTHDGWMGDRHIDELLNRINKQCMYRWWVDK